jgi:hypothetical protein
MAKTQIKESELKTDKGIAIGIGRLKIPKMLSFNYEIPLLSFVVVLEEEKDSAGKNRSVFVASCIHLRIDGYGSSEKEAIRDMIRNVCGFVYENFEKEYKETCWSNMLRLFKSNSLSSLLWDKYHAIQLMFAERGFTTDRYSLLQKKIDSLNTEVKRWKKEAEKEKMKKISGFEFVI